jgi:hypothetical protein
VKAIRVHSGFSSRKNEVSYSLKKEFKKYAQNLISFEKVYTFIFWLDYIR